MSETISHSDHLRATLHVAVLGFGAYVLGNVIVLATAVTLQTLGISVLDQPARRMFIGVVMLQGVAFGGAALAYLRYSHRKLGFIRVKRLTWADIAWVIGGFVTLLLALVSLSKLLAIVGIQTAQSEVATIGNQNPVVFLLLVPLSFLLIGPGEELLFRGVIQGTLAESLHPIRAIIIASALFAIIHVFSLSGAGKFAYVGVVFVLALVLGISYIRTDNLIVPALIHGGYNAVQFGLAYLQAVGSL